MISGISPTTAEQDACHYKSFLHSWNCNVCLIQLRCANMKRVDCIHKQHIPLIIITCMTLWLGGESPKSWNQESHLSKHETEFMLRFSNMKHHLGLIFLLVQWISVRGWRSSQCWNLWDVSLQQRPCLSVYMPSGEQGILCFVFTSFVGFTDLLF